MQLDRMIVMAFSLVVVASIAGCSRDPAKAAASRKELQEIAWTRQMQSRIQSRLKDPGSAEFRNVKLSHKGGGPVVCGEVNSKNSFGGMVGFQRFVSAGDIQLLEEDMKPGEMNPVWAQFC